MPAFCSIDRDNSNPGVLKKWFLISTFSFIEKGKEKDKKSRWNLVGHIISP